MTNRFSSIPSGASGKTKNTKDNEALKGLEYPKPFPNTKTYTEQLRELILKIQQHENKNDVDDFREEWNTRFNQWVSQGRKSDFAKSFAKPLVEGVAESLGLS